MITSSSRIQFISDYISSYVIKIENLNKCGLYDAATLYEIFAQEVGKAWFGKNFYNLNDGTATYPYIDLLSEDNDIYIQVSTVQDIPKKIKNTLTKISKSKLTKFKSIKELYFVVLDNESLDKVEDFSGESKIGNIDFVVSKNLITLKGILEKAKSDLEFQTRIYDILLKEKSSFDLIEEKLKAILDNSKFLIEFNINGLINNEYEINRNDLIKNIKKDNYRFISVQGEAGTGKSALCKKLLENEKYVFYVRAEKVAESNNLDEIWDICLIDVFKYLKRKSFVLYIDALEFIADCPKSKMDLLLSLYKSVEQFSDIKIVVSCRSCDASSFLKLFNLFNVKSYVIDNLSDKQIKDIASKYEVIKALHENKTYYQLLKSPFYIDLIVSKISNMDNLDDINAFREKVWTNIICLKEAELPYQVSFNDIKNTINQIVFTRAKEFLVGVSKDDFDPKIVDKLLSENVITLCDNDKIRLKYDIFEDICFEHYIDKEYDGCKGKINLFFDKIEQLGRCVYRRYQIWVENKLFAKKNRESFIYNLLESNEIPETWRTQTIIGIIKSNYSDEFFLEYENRLQNDLLEEFITCTNLYAFNASIIELESKNYFTQLNPIGAGRRNLIKIAKDKMINENCNFKNILMTLCIDYSKSMQLDKVSANAASLILQKYVREELYNIIDNPLYEYDKLDHCLQAIYKLANVSKEWIKSFWNLVKESYLKSINNDRVYEHIIKNALLNGTNTLAICLPVDYCELANVYWLQDPNFDGLHPFACSQYFDKKDLGLSIKANSYSYDFDSLKSNSFLMMMARYNYFYLLDWFINVSNHVIKNFNKKEDVYEIYLNTNNKKYICHSNFWAIGYLDNKIHDLLGDTIYYLSTLAINTIKNEGNDYKFRMEIVKEIKEIILEKSESIIPFPIITKIGRECYDICPDYLLDLASSMDLIMLDLSLKSYYMPDHEEELLEKQIMMIVGVPEIKKRYNVEDISMSLQDYLIKLQLSGNKDLYEKAINTIDYLYSVIPNDEENADYHLQIQKMDLRKMQLTEMDENLYQLTPTIDGEAKKIVEKNRTNIYINEKEKLNNIIVIFNDKMKKNKNDIKACLNAITDLYQLSLCSRFSGQIEENMVLIIAYALSSVDLDDLNRIKLCNIWIEGIKKYFENGTFSFKIELSNVLFKQLEFNLDANTLSKMKKLILDVLLFKGHNGIIWYISNQLHNYLVTNEEIAKSLFNTIIMISKDRMSEYKYNAKHIKKIDSSFKYSPNLNKPPIHVDELFSENNIEKYKSSKSSIVDKYLIKSEELDLSDFNIDNYSINELCYISNCGLNLNDDEFNNVMRELYSFMIKIISNESFYNDYLDTYSINEVKTFINKNILNKDSTIKVINLMFDSVDFSKVRYDVFEIYEDISKNLLTQYFDAYENKSKRKKIEEVISVFEHKINQIEKMDIKNKLYSMLFLTLGKYHPTDWNEYKTEYSFENKVFLNNLWKNYGYLHFNDYLNVIHQLQIKKLLPEIITSINESITKLEEIGEEEFLQKTYKSRIIINQIITCCLMNYNEQIKMDDEMLLSFEELLMKLINVGISEAAVVLDEFRMH